MKSVKMLESNKIYFTKDGSGNIVKFNEGFIWGANEKVAIPPHKTATKNVWQAGGISRHIKDLAETEEEAKSISYGSSN